MTSQLGERLFHPEFPREVGRTNVGHGKSEETTMNWKRIAGDWRRLLEYLKSKLRKLTPEPVDGAASTT